MGVQMVQTLPTALRLDRERPHSSCLARMVQNGVEIHMPGIGWEHSVNSEREVSSPSGAGFGTRSETEVSVK